jgi:cytoskeletal protein CcmA (bactofilin family)
MKSFILAFISLCFIITVLVAQEKDYPDISSKKIEKTAYEKYITKNGKKDFRFTEDTTINDDEDVNGNVIVVEGDLTIRGQVEGDVLVILGKIKIENNAVINGNVTSIEGNIYQEEKSLINGNQIETRIKNLFPREEWDHDFEPDERYSTLDKYTHRYDNSYSTLPLGHKDQSLLLRYNRVQGLFLGWAIPKNIGGKYNIFSIHGFAGYGIKESKWSYQIGIDRWIFDQRDYRFEIGAQAYDQTDTRDSWMISPLENSLAAFFLHRDFQDFYRRYGYEIHASQNLSIFFKGTLAFRDDKYKSTKKNTDYALFGRDRKFKENPLINEGNMRSIYAELYLDTRDNKENPRRGWYGKLSGETSNTGLNSDFSFNQYIFELRRYQRLGDHERLDLRFMIGTGEGEFPFQKGYELGGLSTLRGFEFKQFRAPVTTEGPVAQGFDRMLLGNVEYNISPRLFNTGFLFFDDIRYIVFFDFGNAWYNSDVSNQNNWSDGFSHLRWNDMNSDFGIALTSWDGKARLSIAKRLDTGFDPIVVTYRISKPF